MNLALTSELDTGRFVLMLGDLMMLSGKDFKTVLLSQTAAILKFCIRNTRAAKAEDILKRATRHSDRYTFKSGEVISESKRHPGELSFLDTSTFKRNRKQAAPLFMVGGKTWHDMTNWRWSDARWAKYQAFLAQMRQMQANGSSKAGADVKAALRSRGLAKHSWFQIAEVIGIAAAVDAPQWVRDATPQNGREYQNGTATVALEAAAAYIEARNDNPVAIRLGGQALINYAVISRSKAFEREVSLGVFEDTKTRAQRYPGLFVASDS